MQIDVALGAMTVERADELNGAEGMVASDRQSLLRHDPV
jgi:hypothetical protein